MKTVTKIIVFYLSLFLLSSCENILKEKPLSLTTADFYYSTPAGIEDGLKAAYKNFRDFYGQERGFTMTDVGTDIWTAGSGTYSQHPHFNDYNINFPSTDNFLSEVWNSFYVGVNQCNAVIGRTPDVEGIDDQTKNRVMGEARFLRALYYFHLVQQWGDVHFTLEETVGVETEANRTPAQTIYDEGIVPDLEFAVNNLPESTTDYGRVTKPAAQALLAKVNLTLGNWVQAEELATNVINNYNFKLVETISDLWNIHNEVNDEIIWAIQYTSDPLTNGQGNAAHMYFHASYNRCPAIARSIEYGLNWSRYQPTNYLIKLFDKENDARWTDGWRVVWLANTKAKINGKTVNIGDTAMVIVTYPVDNAIQSSVPYWLVDFNDNWVGNPPTVLEIGALERRLYPTLLKHEDPLRPSANYSQGSRDIFVIRLAEMYLIAAEAAWRQNRSDDAADFINIIRTRAAVEGKESEMQVDASDINLDFILDEIARELCGEMNRFYDLKRTGKLIERIKLYNLDATANIKEMHKVRPIPQTQIDRVTNPDVFFQNPGYL